MHTTLKDSRLFYAAWGCLLCTCVVFADAHADRVKVLYKDEEASQARVDLIRQAKSELYISYFVVRDDASSLSGFVLLLDAADRGVEVKVIVDSIYLDIALPYLKILTAHPNIHIRVYNRVSVFHLLRAFKRNHEKVILADSIHTGGLHYLTGGRNVSDKYFGFGDQRNFHDLDIYVHGESALYARDEYFLKLWESKLISDISLGPYSTVNLEGATCLQAKKEDDLCSRKIAERKVAYQRALDDIERRRQAMIGGAAAGVDWHLNTRWDLIAREVGAVRFLFDPTDTKKSDKGIATQLYNIIVSDTSIKQLFILSPYVILTRRGGELLSILIERGVEITLVTNSLNSTDNLLAQAGYANDKGWLLEQGLKIYHYIGPDTMHAKAMIMNGGESVMIGSYNFDPRSAKLNREIGAHFHATNDEGGVVVDELDQMLQYYLSRSVAIDRNGIPLGYDREHPNSSMLKKFTLNLLRPIVAIPFIHINL